MIGYLLNKNLSVQLSNRNFKQNNNLIKFEVKVFKNYKANEKIAMM